MTKQTIILINTIIFFLCYTALQIVDMRNIYVLGTILSLLVAFVLIWIIYGRRIEKSTKNIPESKSLNKGFTLFISVLLTIVLFIGIENSGKYLRGISWIITAIVIFFISKKVKMKHALKHALLICFMPLVGTPLFHYNLMKEQSRKKGINVDTPKGVLFYLLICLLIGYELYLLGYVIFTEKLDTPIKIIIVISYIVSCYLIKEILDNKQKQM